MLQSLDMKKSMQSYDHLVASIQKLLEEARRQAARSVNAILTAAYWETGRRIVEFEQKGQKRAGYGEKLLSKLSQDLTKRLGRGYSEDNLENMRLFYLAYSPKSISEALSRKLKVLSTPKISLLIPGFKMK